MTGYLIPLTIAGYALSYNPTLLNVGLYRQSSSVLISIPQTVQVGGFECRLGVPYSYRHMTGLQVYFESEGVLHGPFLVTDYERPEHSGTLENRNLLADIDCPRFVHARGRLVVKSSSMRM